MILIATHAVFDEQDIPRHGTGTELGNYFRGKKLDYCFVRHALNGEAQSEIEDVRRGVAKKKAVGFKRLMLPLRLLQDQILNFYLLFKYQKRLELFIGIDPLNATSGIIAKKLGIIDKVIFYTADYAHNRFANKYINRMYHKIDQFAAKNADQVWNVSSRIANERRKQGIGAHKNFFIPNTPEFKKTKRLPLNKINKHDLVIVSNLTNAIDYPLMIKAVKRLKAKYTDIRLVIIGSGELEHGLKKLVSKLKLKTSILFLGSKSHDEVLEILSQSGVGVAMYTKNKPWTVFGDSLKVREYLACGLPVIMNDIAATADDISKFHAGIVLQENEDFEQAVDMILSSAKKYIFYRKNAIRLAQKYDFTKAVDHAFARIA